MTERKGTKALELWCKKLLTGYDGVLIENMTTSWRNGLAFCALIHRFRPDLIDFGTLKPEDIYQNNELAFRTAETHLGIPALLDPEDMVDSEIPDRLSVLTYLSQFYKHLGNPVTKAATHENNNEFSLPSSPLSTKSPLPQSIAASLRLGKSGGEVCTACGLSVYLAQRLMVSRKLYHHSCFRCSSCNAQLSPHACYEDTLGTKFCCEACKNKPDMPPLQEEDDRMGMLLLDEEPEFKELAITTPVVKRQSVLDKIKMFENTENDSGYTKESLGNSFYVCSGDVIDGKQVSSESVDSLNKDDEEKFQMSKTEENEIAKISNMTESVAYTDKMLDKSYKSDVHKLSFLQTQLSTDLDDSSSQNMNNSATDDMLQNFYKLETKSMIDKKQDEQSEVSLEYVSTFSNVPDDVRLEKLSQSCKITDEGTDKNDVHIEYVDKPVEATDNIPIDVPVIIPPRRRNGTKTKAIGSAKKDHDGNESGQLYDVEHKKESPKQTTSKYPQDLNPFSEDESEDEAIQKSASKKANTNPFGSSDDENEDELKIGVTPVKITPPRSDVVNATASLNPFWSDGEEPSSDEESQLSASMYSKSSLTASTPNLQRRQRRPKPPAPRPPSIHVQTASPASDRHDDCGSLSSISSHCSTVNSESKSGLRLSSSPRPRKKRPAPSPPDSLIFVSGARSSDLIQSKNPYADEPDSSKSLDGRWRRVKGPAPGLPLPGRRVVVPQMSPTELQTQLDLLETQQLGLERQGVLIEQMIRDKCEGEDTPAPADEVEELVIQLCELVNEKNDLFRKQAELMHIRRQQRLEQEQADIEHEIRVIQSCPAVNRIDADKAREEQLVSRLVEVVRLRDELVQQLDCERRRERAEDAAIALSIAERRAKRNSDSNTSSLKSEDIVRTPKKSKVKDRMKKHIKKAKNTLSPKKKESDGGSSKESKEGDESGQKREKSKWF